MSGHTPGPWRFVASALVTGTGATEKDMVAAVVGASREDQQLIAAAPELAAASRDFLRWFRSFIGDAAYNEIRADELDALRSALAKAGL